MKMKNILCALLLTAAAGLAGCSQKNDTGTAGSTEAAETSGQATATAASMNSKPKGDIRQQIEKGTLNADDLTAEDAVTALTIYYEICSQSTGNGRYKAANEAMRNYVDVYDIVKTNRKTDFTRLADRPVLNDATMSLTDAYTHFQERLAQYEGGGSWGNSGASAKDSLKTQTADSIAGELSPEFRPAE